MTDLNLTQVLGSRSRSRRVFALVAIIFLVGTLSVYFTLAPINSLWKISTNPKDWSWHPDQYIPTSQQANQQQSDTSPLPIMNSPSLVASADLSKDITKEADGYSYPPHYIPQLANQAPREKAGFIVLVRNNELDGIRNSMRDVEFRFNRKYGYPWIFLNNEPFTEEFINGVKQMTRSETRFGLVPKEQWSYPDWISPDKAAETRVIMKNLVPYGDSESYRHMCRYQSGFFFRHELTLDLDYYWRVEPGIELHCDIDYDPFRFMAINNKTYGFTITLHEFIQTVTTLYDTTRDFVKLHPSYVNKEAAMHFLTDDKEKSISSDWNLCHFWSNFEIGDLRFWRGKEYTEYFDYLDKNGGFFYERWGDAPVHSIAAALFLNKSQIHHFDDIGYFHHPWLHCPTNKDLHQQGKCSCDPNKSFDRDDYSCMKQWWSGSGH